MGTPRRSIAHGVLWRTFPWDRSAPEGAPFSCRSVAPGHTQNYGRFDLHGQPPVLYLAQTPAHALAEVLRGLKQHPADPFDPARHCIDPADLRSGPYPRAIVGARLPAHVADAVPDLCRGDELARFGVRADELCSRDRRVTQAAARRIHAHPDAVPGFCWWSALHGDWHVAVLFLDRVGMDEIELGAPEVLTMGHAAVAEAAEVLGLDV
jgi:RES domain